VNPKHIELLGGFLSMEMVVKGTAS